VTTLYLLLAAFLILLNAFFVLAEFAIVKMRPSRAEQLAGEGHAGAKLVQHMQGHMDEYISVCQVGITLASIGLGFVGQPAFAGLFIQLTGSDTAIVHGLATTFAVILVSALHIVLGEQVPKMFAIRRTEGSSLVIARPLAFFRTLFYLPLVILNGATRGILWLLGIRGRMKETDHSEEELRILLSQSQSTGLMSFRRLLLLENIFDLSEVRVRDAMRGRDAVKVLRLGVPWEENFKVIRDSRFSRFPLVDSAEMPLGIVHIKDLLHEGLAAIDLKKIARPYFTTTEDLPLETLMGEIQRQRGHLAIVRNSEGKWSGIISLEDIIEEIVGSIEDEFEVEPPIYLADALTPDRVVLGIEASSIEEAIGQAFGRVAATHLPLPVEKIVKAVLERERAMSTYLGNGLAIPHARLEGVDKPAILFVRSDSGVPLKGRDDKAHFIFILMTPTGSPRIQVRLLARICGLIGSEYVVERLRRAGSHAEVVEAIRAAASMTQS
jgi:CBS domain containing-hemolysin-like protein